MRRSNRQRPLLHHQTHDLIQRIRRRHRRQLRIRVVRGRDLDDIRSDEVDPLQAADDGPQLACGPAARLRRAGRGCEGRVQRIDVNAEVDWILGANSVPDGLDDARRADGVDLPRLDAREAAVAVVVVVRQSRQGGADAGVDVGVVGEEAFLGGPVEVRAVVDGGLLGRGAAEHLGPPGVEVAVEVDDADGAVGFVDAAEEGERDGVVAAEGDEAGEGFSLEGEALFVSVGVRRAHEQAVVAVFDLLDCIGIVVASELMLD